MVKKINFVAKPSKSGAKRLINIPRDKLKDLEDIYYKVVLTPVVFDED